MEQLVKAGCGLDVHKELVVATIRRNNQAMKTQEFAGYTSSLTELRDWCKTKGVIHVAMESTGIYHEIDQDYLKQVKHQPMLPIHPMVMLGTHVQALKYMHMKNLRRICHRSYLNL